MKKIAVPSLTDRQQQWVVTFDEAAGRWTCDCPRASFTKHGEDAPCKHVEIAKVATILAGRCSHVGGEAICVACLASMLATAARKVRGEVKEARRAGKQEVLARAKARREKKRDAPKAGVIITS